MAKENLSWWQKKSVYQIYPKSFLDTTGSGTGDLRGVIKKLDYIASLGVGAIWLTPFFPSPMVDNGYDISNYTDIDPRFGTMADFEELVAQADKRGIKIVVDLVFNHSSDKNQWFLESKSSKTNPKADWYIWRDEKTNWRSIFGGSAWEFCEERGQYYLHTFATAQPDLNWENPEVRQALYDAANFWLDKGAGGFRIDAIVYIKKPSEFKDGIVDSEDGLSSIHNITAACDGILDYLREFKEKVFVGRDIFTVAEANGVKPENLSEWVGKTGVFVMLFEF
ncbi:MAG: glucohydrolase, partial [Selenomonadaceae bacterium]|nr:glucohydrolase [Selenomonadaceae bacterium]